MPGAMKRLSFFLILFLPLVEVGTLAAGTSEENGPAYEDAAPQRYDLTARASVIDPRTREHPEIGFVFEKDGKPQDIEHACVDTRIAPRGRLVIWLMGYNRELFDRTASYGLHSIQVHYANAWFGKLSGGAPPADPLFLSKIRLEAATGEDQGPSVDIPKPDGIMERSYQLVKWLAKENPAAKWEQFLTPDGTALQWEKVILAGASHGSTTAARFAKHQKVARVVMFCGPRDQLEVWQSLPSATPANRYFGFSHVLDQGWQENHYPRSWKMLGLGQFGPVVDVDHATPPYGSSRRLTTAADVHGDANLAHGAVTPGKNSPKDAAGKYLYEDVWRYLFTFPVEEVNGSGAR